MKTSNKILLGFFILIFLIPVFVLMSFKSMVRNGKFVVVKNEAEFGGNHRSGDLKPYKVVKLVSPEGRLFKCDLQYSDSAQYNYYNGTDSLRIYNQADTLFAEYVNVLNEKAGYEQFRDELQTDLKLPSINHLIVDGAEATVASGDTTANSLYAEVYRKGLLQIGTSESTHKIDKLTIKVNDGEIILGKETQIDELYFDVNGNSSLTIEEGAEIKSMRGNLSDSSSVKASWKYLKKLLSLTK